MSNPQNTASRIRQRMLSVILVAVNLFCLWGRMAAGGEASFAPSVRGTQPKIVKIFGAGGLDGLEPYQSGFLISDQGHILTVWSYVLDTDSIAVILDDGRKFESKLVGADPRLEVAVLKIDGDGLDAFALADAPPYDASATEIGTRVLAFSNLFGVATGEEPASVQHGAIAARTLLDARRGAATTLYRGPVYIVDAMTNNPGAAGGALTDGKGRLLALLGKEMRSAQSGVWINYAIPIDQLRDSVERIMAGKTLADAPRTDLRKSGLRMAAYGARVVPDVLERTPPYIDQVLPDSPADRAGLRRDDLIVYVGDRLIPSCKGLVEELDRHDSATPLRLVVMRGQELVDLELAPAGEPALNSKPATEQAP